jgi:hypothetical protein
MQQRQFSSFGSPGSITQPAPVPNPPGGVLGYIDPRSTAPVGGFPSSLGEQQSRFHQVLVDQEKENWPLSLAAMLPSAMLAGLGAVDVFLAGEALPYLRATPVSFPEREALGRTGNFFEVRKGQAVHKAMEAQVKTKPGWDWGKQIRGSKLRPDIRTPRERYMELKPNTPYGKRAAAEAVKRYKSASDRPTRAIYYDPDEYDIDGNKKP